MSVYAWGGVTGRDGARLSEQSVAGPATSRYPDWFATGRSYCGMSPSSIGLTPIRISKSLWVPLFSVWNAVTGLRRARARSVDSELTNWVSDSGPMIQNPMAGIPTPIMRPINGSMSILERCNMSPTSRANTALSMSPEYDRRIIFLPENNGANRRRSVAIASLSERDRFRGATNFSILTRAMRSSSAVFFRPSASFLNCAASFSFCDAALSAELETSMRSWTSSPFFMLSSVWTVPALISITHSPDTPMATRPAPSNSANSFRPLGFFGELIHPRWWSSRSSRYSQITKPTSITTPITTSITQKYNQSSSELDRLSSALIELRSAATELAIAEESMDHLRRARQRGSIVTLIAIAALIAVRIGWWIKCR